MPAPDSTQEEVRTSVLKYIRMYEEGALTLGDLAAELSSQLRECLDKPLVWSPP